MITLSNEFQYIGRTSGVRAYGSSFYYYILLYAKAAANTEARRYSVTVKMRLASSKDATFYGYSTSGSVNVDGAAVISWTKEKNPADYWGDSSSLVEDGVTYRRWVDLAEGVVDISTAGAQKQVNIDATWQRLSISGTPPSWLPKTTEATASIPVLLAAFQPEPEPEEPEEPEEQQAPPTGVQVYADGVLAYDSRLEDYNLAGLTVTTGLDIGGTAEIVMPVGHPAYNLFVGYKTIVTVYRDGVLRFRGRALYPADNFYGQRTITCEGELCLLRDSIARPYLYQDTPAGILAQLVAAHNSQVESFKQFTIGTVTVVDGNDYVRLESEDASTVLDAINKLKERCGGHIVFTNAPDGSRVLNWYASLDYQSDQTIEFGENLLDFTSTGANTTDLATGLIPYGAKDEKTKKRLTIETVNDGKDYIIADDAQQVRGTIMVTAIWDDVTEPENLLQKAQAMLEQRKFFITSLELTALDLSYLDKDLDSFAVGDMIQVISAPHGVDEFFQLSQMTEDLLDPSKSRITLGKDTLSLTGAGAAGDRKRQNDLDAVKVEMVSDYTINEQQIAETVERTMASQITQRDATIMLQVSQTYARKDALAATNASIETLAGSITLDVSGGLGGSASLVLTVNGTTQSRSLDLSEIRKAFANDLSNVVISGGTVTFNTGTLIVNSTNLQVDKNGTLTAKNVELSGSLTTESGLYKSRLNSGKLRFYYDSAELGSFASTYYTTDNSKRGIAMQIEPDTAFISFSAYDAEDGAYTPAYIINYGMNPSGHTERHLFYGNARFISKTWFDSNLAFANNTGIRFTDTDGTETAIFRMDTTNLVRLGTSGYNTLIAGKEIELNNTTRVGAGLYCESNAYIANGYGLWTYTKGDTVATPAVWMDDGNHLYFGTTDYTTYLRGYTLMIGHSDYNTMLYGKWVYLKSQMYCDGVNITFANGYGIRLRDSNGTDSYAFSMPSSNNVLVGATDYQLRLRGTSVVLNSSGAAVTSDRRLKNSIEAIPDAYLDALDKLTPVRFKYNDGTSGRYHVGFIAQEVQEALTAAGLTTQDFGGFVDLNGDGTELGLVYTQFIGLLHQKIRRLEQKINELEGVTL